MILGLLKLCIQNLLIDNLKAIQAMKTKLKSLIQKGKNLTTEFKESNQRHIPRARAKIK